MPHKTVARTRLAYLVMLVAPLFFASNMVFGRSVVNDVSPFTLALLRWLIVATVLLPVMYGQRHALQRLVKTRWRLLLLIAFLGMWFCGGGVYLGLRWTTATNGTLIYTTSPVIILLMEAAFKGRRIGLREGLGALLAFLGVCVIVMRGDLAALTSLQFNIGDLMFVGAAIAWAAYSILYRSPALEGLSNAAMLGLMALAGALLLLPAAGLESAAGAVLPTTTQAWMGIAGIVIFPSLLAFSTFQFGIRELGAPVASMFMYLMPPYGVLLAMVFLGEELALFHLVGIALVMGGVVLATFPSRKRAAS